MFQDKLKPHLLELFPDASRIVFTYNVVRGGQQFGDQPAAIGAPHLDYSQNDTARKNFHEVYPIFSQAREQFILLGMEDTDDDDEFEVILGVWKPIGMMTGVCNHPLAVMDARTFLTEHSTNKEVHIDFGVFTFHNLNGGMRYHPNQQFHHYSFQEDSEVRVFTQYTRDKFKCKPSHALCQSYLSSLLIRQPGFGRNACSSILFFRQPNKIPCASASAVKQVNSTNIFCFLFITMITLTICLNYSSLIESWCRVSSDFTYNTSSGSIPNVVLLTLF